MRFTKSFIMSYSSLLALTSANFVRFYDENSCGGAYNGCENIGANVCCAAVTGTYPAVAISKGPLDVGVGWGWEIARGYCGRSECTGGGEGTLCCVSPDGGPIYDGGSFYTIAKKRSGAAISAEPQRCTSTQEANAFGVSVGGGQHWQIVAAEYEAQETGKSFSELSAAFHRVSAEDAVEWLQANGAVLVTDTEMIQTIEGTPKA